MKVVRFSFESKIHFGILDGEEVVVLEGDPIGYGFEPTSQRVPITQISLLAPVIPRSKIVGVGLNYRDHIAEFGRDVPEEPVLFLKPNTSVIGPGDPILLPEGTGRVDFEGELAIVIAKVAKDVPASRAKDYIFGYTLANDVTSRTLQKRDGQWARAKGFDTFCPLGPAIETELDISDDLRLVSKLNGEVKQDEALGQMLYKVPEIIALVSAAFTLLPGDVILTGTPSGVSAIKDSDVVEIEIEGIGRLRNPVRSKP